MEIWYYVGWGVVGVCVGSFLNVAIWRLPRGASLVRPGSHCPRCSHPLRWRDNVPVLSYLWLRGRCAFCRRCIAAAYPVVEATTGGIFVVWLYAFGWSLVLAKYLVLALVLVVAAEVDRRHGIVPNRLVGFGAVAGVLVVLVEGSVSLAGVLPAVLVAGGFVLLLRVGTLRIVGRPGIGMGDVKLLAMAALYLGWESLWVFYLAALLAGGLGLAGIAAGRLHRTSRLPFAPFVAAGTGLHLFFLPPSTVLPF